METSFVLPAYPFETKNICNYLYSYYIDKDIDLIKDYNLSPFSINCQTIERTFVDKIFAICDYYLLNKSSRLSRHIYDIHMLYPYIKDINLNNLFTQIRELRSKINLCPSAKPDVDIRIILNEIINTNYYQKDYENITTKLIFDDVQYEDVISTLSKFANSFFK